MTEYEKMKIPELRASGMGYKAIANVLGLSRDAVRGFCRKYGLTGNAEVMQKNIELKVKNGILCLNCSRPIESKNHGRKRKFCCDECRRQWWKHNTDKINRRKSAMYQSECSCCHKQFISYGNRHRKYCSHKCYINDRFKKTAHGNHEPILS